MSCEYNNVSEDLNKQTELIKTETLYNDSSENNSSEESQEQIKLDNLQPELMINNDTIHHISHLTALTMEIPELKNYITPKETLNIDLLDINQISKKAIAIDIPESKHYNINPLIRSDSFTQEPINGWDNDAMKTITNWYDIFKQQSFMYQWILEKNLKISNKLIMASIIASSALGIFTSFKIWINKDSFNTVSDLFLMLSNFSIALMTGYSKSYVDNRRNESIKHHIQEIDELFGEICAQLLKSPVYRMNANDFFKEHNNKFTKLMSSTPSMTIYELKQSKKEYELFKKNFYNNI